MTRDREQALRDQWAHRLSYFSLSFTDTTQTYPRTGDKKHGGKVHSPPPTTERQQPNNRIEESTMNEQSEVQAAAVAKSFGNNLSDIEKMALREAIANIAKLSDPESTKRIEELTEELKKSQKLSAKAKDAAAVATGIVVAVTIVATVTALLTKSPAPVMGV